MAAIPNKIVIGELDDPILVFENDAIQSVESETAVSMIGDELFIDQFLPVVEYEVYVSYLFKPTNYDAFASSEGLLLCSRENYDLRLLPYGTRITYYHNNRVAGEFFCKTVERAGAKLYKITGMSAVGLMNYQFHYGGIYTGQSFPEVVADILGDGYEYTFDGLVAAQRVFGWLPYSTKRRNLYQLVMAYGVQITKGDSGKMFFTFLESGDGLQIIPQDRIFVGGSVTYDEPASRVELTEHSYHYVPDVDEEVLFDHPEEYVENTLISFDHPIYPESIHAEEEGTFEFHAVGVNYVRVSGIGRILGKPYTHTTRVLHEDNDAAQSQKVVKVEDATLVSMMNSENVMLRLAAYYFHATRIRQDIIVDEEKAGGEYILWNAFKEYATAWLTKMSTRASSFRRATCEFIQNYTPVGQGASYTHRLVIPLPSGASQTWSIPEEVFEKEKPTVRVVLIGWGDDGQPGEDGEKPPVGSEYNVGPGGAGGLGGLAGKGGRVFPVTLLCDDLTEIMLANDGRNSVLRSSVYNYNSADGVSSATGYYDPYSGELYALPGVDGIAGARGGDGGQRKPQIQEIPAKPGEDVEYNGETYHGGAASESVVINGGTVGVSSNLDIHIAGSGGGGAAAGVNGGDATGYISASDWNEPGVGATPVDAPATPAVLGHGGNGGHGGGGGGGGGLAYWYNRPNNYITSVYANYSGEGGKGGNPSPGMYGGAILYW